MKVDIMDFIMKNLRKKLVKVRKNDLKICLNKKK